MDILHPVVWSGVTDLRALVESLSKSARDRRLIFNSDSLQNVGQRHRSTRDCDASMTSRDVCSAGMSRRKQHRPRHLEADDEEAGVTSKIASQHPNDAKLNQPQFDLDHKDHDESIEETLTSDGMTSPFNHETEGEFH